MKLLKLAIAALSIALLSTGTVSAENADRYGKQKVVYHINYPGGPENKAYRGALRNIQNHINAVGAEHMDIKVVLHGNGLGVLMAANSDETLQTTVGALKGQDVAFHVCQNTLNGRKISYEDDLYDVWQSDIVPSGVAELSRLQQLGYTYIKP